MKTHSRPSPAAGSSRCQTATHPPRPSSKTAKSSTTPMASPRPPYSVGQNSPPLRSPGRHHDIRAPSPNYFGLVVESNSDPRESSGLGRDNWSPASSSVKSFAAALPKQVTLDANPDFEAFKRQADLNRGKSFSLPTVHLVQPTLAPVRPRPPRWHTHTSDAGSETSFPRSVSSTKERPISRMDVDHDNLHDSAYVSADSKRNSEASLHPTNISLSLPPLPLFESPHVIDSPRRVPPGLPADDKDGRLSAMENRTGSPFPPPVDVASRSATMPAKLDPEGPPMISCARLKELLETVEDSRLLVLDIRSSQNFATSRIKGALNICIPTTLLKRPTFNIQKLQQTFQGGMGSAKFADWRDMSWIVVYDAHASDKRDALGAQNMIKKFTSEGFSGNTAILRGGFNIFHKSYQKLIDTGSTMPPPGPNECNGRANGGLAPVIGGVNLPQSGGDVNPFFSNIRQNMDLADGVGQFDVARPADLQSNLLPDWLQQAASEADHGKKVSQKFLRIELDEQARMKSAYAAFNPNHEQRSKFQLSGVEKGGKNRYKDILPFEHARVRLQSPAVGSCDYVNASHLSASRSHKRYIASQGPLPATFEDFWSVIWEQDVRVIVMLTAESEGGQLKCHSYWKGKDFGAIRLRPLSEKKASLDLDKHRSDTSPTYPSQTAAESGRKRANTTTTMDANANGQTTPQNQSEAPYVIIRKFALSHSAHPFAPIREITQLYFPAWPDFGTPAQPSHLLALVELANMMQRAALPVETASIFGSRSGSMDSVPVAWYDEPESDLHARPMLVHCSAGCGRTGTFCTVDSVIDMLKRQRQAKAASGRVGSQQSDTFMTGTDEPVSPGTKRVEPQGFFDTVPSQSSHNGLAPPGSDAGWLQDDKVDLIQKTVEDFREQRLSMVQSLRQYVLCYETILEWMNRAQDRVVNTGPRRRSGSLQQPRRYQ
ncbi:hypothetical protein HIM_08634 [Hirsutella minnesotensis 3608]|uniref:protein-tyrosine-phosphatase n=1 Tax=Hirsutella minnesotensis 3608 TaxID=1043627 RepID=A0A0F8A3J8_9HYPO|nr:hypothetical protein HIM_08634 [Hirsutella minnesotensis 3608]